MTQQSGQPNQYVFTAQDFQLTYSTSTLDGQPEFDYQGLSRSRTFKGKDIGTQQSALGTLVSVRLLPSLDATTVSLTLLLPYIRMAGQNQQSFETLAIQTTSAGPDTFGGGAAQQTYQVYQLQGTARFTEAVGAVTVGAVTLNVDSTTYNVGDPIVVTLSNQGTQSITVSDHLTNCTIIQLQRQEDGTWNDVYPCNREIATFPHTVEPGQSLTVELDGVPDIPGLYRATESSRTIYSQEIEVLATSTEN